MDGLNPLGSIPYDYNLGSQKGELSETTKKLLNYFLKNPEAYEEFRKSGELPEEAAKIIADYSPG